MFGDGDRDAHIKRGVAVGGRSHDPAFFGEAQSPGVVGGGLQGFEGGSVACEAQHSHTHLVLHTIDGGIDARVADRGVNPAIHAELEVGDTGVGVPELDARPEDGALFGFAVPVLVPEKHHVHAIGGDAAVFEWQHGGGDGQAGGELGALVRLAVAIGVFKDDDLVLAGGIEDETVRVIEGFSHPQSAADIPSHGDGVGHHGLGGKQLQTHARRHLGELHRVLG